MINEINLELDEHGRLLYAWGYCPLFLSASTTVRPRRSRYGALLMRSTKSLVPGSSLRLNAEKRWPVYVNNEDGWICVGEPRAAAQAVWIEFAPATIAVLVDAEIRALWLRPVALPKQGSGPDP